ncbi:uncharacterized protein LOC131675938 [Topomyia yanbarensis]|uniref:uncharacterized protein LOC131675938 n=1 Tax=Topomyia yanbarensis TaxID=2498891 RepID=UPI00273C9E68|nr:uncharacterized protein LOC131675938 [Topomyia yanbarensis]
MAPSTSSKGKSLTLKALQTKLKGLQTSFNNMYQFIEQCTVNSKASEFSVRLERLEPLWDKMNDAVDDVAAHEDNVDTESTVKDRLELKDDPEASALNQSTRMNDTAQIRAPHAKLPQISLPKFGGKIDDWLNFRDLYMSLIHWQTDLPEVEKFHYLRSQLEGEALNLVNTLPLTKANYMVAWDMLVQRYSNTKLLKKRKIQALFELSSIKRESAEEMHSLLESFEAIVKSLDHIVSQPADYKDLLLLHMLSSRLDSSSRRSWEDLSSSREDETLKDLTDFMRRRIQMLEAISTKQETIKNDSAQLSKRKFPLSTKICNAAFQASSSKGCPACPETHPLYQCSVFKGMPVHDKENLLRTNSLCRNCFRRGHQAKECSSKYTCRRCKGRHHTLVCFKDDGKPNNSNTSSKDSTDKATEEGSCSSSSNVNVAAVQVVSCNSVHVSMTGVMLLTAMVMVQDESGCEYPARGLLDCACQCDLVSKRFSTILKSKRRTTDLDVIGVNGKVEKVTNYVRVVIKSRVSDFQIPVELNIHPRLSTIIPGIPTSTSGWKIPQGLKLADPSLFESHQVDLILGRGSFFDFFRTGQRISLGDTLPLLVESVFGWVVSGRYPVMHNNRTAACNVVISDSLEEFLTRFWRCEEISQDYTYSPEEIQCEEHFKQTFQRKRDGRYVVSLPKHKDTILRLGDSRTIAQRRFIQMETRLQRNPDLKRQYHEFTNEYEQLGHMRLVPEADVNKVQRYYLPHHPVVKESSATTRVRVVFDASCKTASGVSLNDALLAGPVIQDDLRSIILRCRTRLVMLVADVEKMFRQININGSDAPLQCILWRSKPEVPPSTYELTTITYGTKPAPFLATRTLKQLALDEANRFPLAARAVIEDFYIDDAITGTNDPAQATALRIQLDGLLRSGGLRLRKWASNYPEVLEGVNADDLAISIADGIELEPDPSVKTLGLVWYPTTDVFALQIQVPQITIDLKLTKRMVLSFIAMLFDPLGLIGAVITTAKVFMQMLWMLENEKQERLDWDSSLPARVEINWRAFHEQIPLLKQIRVDRRVTISEMAGMEIHCFSDASQKAYGVNLYIRSWDSEGRVKTALFAFKSRVAPLKSQSIPRLELCGALMAAELYAKVKEAVRFTGDAYFWTDSTTVLQWLRAVPTVWTTYVANRVAKIQSITENCTWRHVTGSQNPADLISRGILPEEIILNTFWWEGPAWLSIGSMSWPSQVADPEAAEAEEERKRAVIGAVVSCSTEFNNWYFARYSNYTVLIRTTAYCQRFIRNFRKKYQIGLSLRPTIGALTTEELRKAEQTIVHRVQKEAFAKEYEALLKGKPVSRLSPLRWFHPRLSSNEVIRIGGRLGKSYETEEAKHPMVLPARHHITRLLLRHYHEKMLHAGVQLLLSAIRQRFWPLGGRSVAKQIVHKCMRCYRTKPTTIRQFIAELPTPRVTAGRPFTTTGVDYFGPIYIRPGYRRAAVKAYVSVFVCFATKAVHLELAGDLTTSCFIQALRRFVSRRGRCATIFSDNGTNFVGARNQLAELISKLKNKQHHEEITKECAKDNIN